MLCPRLARADSYALTPATAPATNPSGGTATGGDGTTEGYYNGTVPYTNDLSGYGAETGASSGGDPCDCSGSVSWDFTWQPTAPGTPPPQSVIVVQGCAAGFTGSGGATGDGANGFGDPPVALPDGVGSVSGLDGTGDSYIPHYSGPSGGQSVSVSSVGSPRADGTADAGGGYAECWVFSTCAVSPVTINPVGATSDGSGGYDILIGQQCQPTLQGIPQGCTVTCNWSVSGGSPFAGYVASSASATYTPLGSQTGSAFVCYFAKPDSVSITCTAHVTPPAGSSPAGGFNLTVTQSVTVQKPSASLDIEIGSVTDLPTSTNPNAVALEQIYRDPPDGNAYGITWNGVVTTPSSYATSGDYGSWEWTQLITASRQEKNSGVYWLFAVNTTTPATVINGVQVLDGSYPYGGFSYPSDGTPNGSADSPSDALDSDSAIRAKDILDSFADFLMYTPPGPNSLPVPLKETDWYWEAHATKDASNVWSTSGEGAAWSFGSDFPSPPLWTFCAAIGHLVYVAP